MSFFGITVFGAQNAFRDNWKINNLIDLFSLKEYLSGFDRVVGASTSGKNNSDSGTTQGNNKVADIAQLREILEKTWLGPVPRDSEARVFKACEGLSKITRDQFRDIMQALIAEDVERKQKSDCNPVGYRSSVKMRADRRNFKSKERPVAAVYAKVIFVFVFVFSRGKGESGLSTCSFFFLFFSFAFGKKMANSLLSISLSLPLNVYIGDLVFHPLSLITFSPFLSLSLFHTYSFIQTTHLPNSQ